MTYSIIKKFFYTEFCSWPDEIELCVTPRLHDQIESARNILKYNSNVQKLYIEVPSEVISKQSFIDMQYACRFEMHSIIVEDVHVRYYVESAWSKTIRAEYDFTHLIPHPVIEVLNNENQALDANIAERYGTQDSGVLYEVQTLTASDGWLNTWSVIDDDNKSIPQTFTSYRAAQKEIDEHIADTNEAIENGDLDAVIDEFRIVKISQI
ncbi:hypothetical protein [Aquimarina macrocephali]|uniref:hypothetical protein n=1 Tax=Aquimarina macrocephali TaxID=666563 RepID=UPI0004635A75|nr:hypothetical protein [Aquimarina macrocephali]